MLFLISPMYTWSLCHFHTFIWSSRDTLWVLVLSQGLLGCSLSLHSPLPTSGLSPHRPEHLESDWNKKGQGLRGACALQEPAAMYRSTDWAGPYPQPEPSDRSPPPQRLWTTVCYHISMLSVSEWRGRRVKVFFWVLFTVLKFWF